MAIGTPQADGWISLRSGNKAPIVDAFQQIQRLHAHLSGLVADDALHLARAAWDTLLTMPRQDLGPDEGHDLCALIFTRSEQHATLSGIGIDRIWAWTHDALTVIAGPDHPELSAPGIPKLPPRALVLEEPAALYLGLCHDEKAVPNNPEEALRLSGLST